MVEQAYNNVEVLYIKDIGNDEIWSKNLDAIISSQIGPGQTVVLYGGRDSFVPHYKGKFATQELVPTKYISGKEIRKNVGIKSKATAEFREGVIWAVENQWPSALPTVDVAIMDPPKNRVLLCRKPNEKFLRFVGGFAKPDSESYEEDAKREVLEETHLECGDFRYIGSARIRDWRYEGERNKIKTTFFSCLYISGSPEADDDIAEVEWVSYDAFNNEEQFVPEHRVLVDMFRNRVLKVM